LSRARARSIPCLIAVERCDIFFGIITPHYGSGQAPGQPAITHQELRKAIELDKPRFMLAHEHVVNARRLLMDLDLTPKEYQERYASDVTPRQARRDLEELEAMNWLVREGATRSTKYRLP